MDIRKYMQVKASPAPVKKRRIEDDDDDVIPESPNVQIKNKKKKTTSNLALKEVKVANLFGNGPIKRTEPVVKKAEQKKIKNTEIGIHSDDEFEKSLLEIDKFDDIEFKTQQNYNHVSINVVKDKQLPADPLMYPSKKGSHNPKHSLSLSKTKSDKDKTPHKYSSTKEEIKITHLETKKVVDDLKKDIRDAKKRKFADFIESDENVYKKKKTKDSHRSKDTLDDSTKNNDKPYDSHRSRHKSDDSSNDKEKCVSNSIRNKSHGFHKQIEKSEDLHKNNSSDSNKNDKPYDTFHNKSHESHKSRNKSDDSKKNKTNSDVNVTDISCNLIDDSMEDETDQLSYKKKKMNKSLNESVSALTDEERHERKRHSAVLYQKYLNRTGPKNLGDKEMPEGVPGCFKDYVFLLTGVLDSFEREEIEETIKKYGGCVKSGISKKVTHVLAGEDAGPAKMAKAEELGIKIINEDEFLKLLDKTKVKSESKKGKTDDKRNHKNKPIFDISMENVKKEKSDKNHESTKIKLENNKKQYDNAKVNSIVKLEELKSDGASEATSTASLNSTHSIKTEHQLLGTMWVEKHKPQSLKQIIGQHGESSNVNKLINWLKKWYVNRKLKIAKPSPWAKSDDGGFFKAALLSGPPGVGKTTTVSLVCKELGFDMVEFNASDTRNKTLIKEQIGELLTTTSLSAYAMGVTGKQAVTKKHVLVMDEVDGMAGNEDRGGLQELIGLIKTASVPIICMCNDRNSQKMRSLVNYCYDLRFSRPKVEQIKAAMRSVCCKENMKIPPDVLGQLIVSANQDVRQTLNLLSMWAVDPTRMDADRLSADAATTKKDVKLGPWDAIRKVFSSSDHKTMTINDKSDLFFYDYSLAPLFVQENYLQVQPNCPKNEVLDRISKAADSIAFGDTIDKRIRSAQAWSLLPMQAMFSSVIPGHHMSGHMTGQIQFPGWLGKNSRKTKMHRLCQEIHAHTRLSTTGSKSSIFLDYAPHLRDAILKPLIADKAEGIEQSLQVLESYHLLREDLESLTELSMWPGAKNPAVLVDSKVKAAMTRTYNKKATALPYAPGSIKRGKARDDDETDDNDNDVDDEVDSDPENDALIKKKKSKESEKSSSSDKPNCSKASKGKSANGKGKKK